MSIGTRSDGRDTPHESSLSRRHRFGRLVRPSAVYDGHAPRRPELVGWFGNLAPAG